MRGLVNLNFMLWFITDFCLWVYLYFLFKFDEFCTRSDAMHRNVYLSLPNSILNVISAKSIKTQNETVKGYKDIMNFTFAK